MRARHRDSPVRGCVPVFGVPVLCVVAGCLSILCPGVVGMDEYGVATVSRIDKLQVSFAEYRLFGRPLLQKRPIILSILLTNVAPYMKRHIHLYNCNLCRISSLW